MPYLFLSVGLYSKRIQNLTIYTVMGFAKSLQSCLTLCDPIDGSPPDSPVPGILQARTLEWVAISFSNAWEWKVKVKLLSRVQLLVTPWTAAHQAPPSMGFSRQEYWSGLPLPSPVMGFRIHYFKLWYLGILNILSWRSLKKWQKQDDTPTSTLPFFLETDHEIPMWDVSSLYPEERSILISKDSGTPRRIWTNNPCVYPVSYTYLILWPTVYLHNGVFFIKPSNKILGYTS